MAAEWIAAFFALALGFVLAGMLTSLYQMVTAQPARFELSADTMAVGLLQTFVIMFAGPAILMRNAIRGRLIERRPVGWLFASTAIASAWSLCSGVMLLPFFVVLARTLA